MSITDYEEVSIYPLDDEAREALLRAHNECVFNWSTKDGWPVGVVMSYLWKDGRFWLTASGQRKRIAAVRREARVSVVVSSTGTRQGPGKTVTAKGTCFVHDDDATKKWFYPEFARHLVRGDERQADGFARMLDSPRRVVLEVTPSQWITFDGTKMAADSMGGLGKPLER